METIEQVEGFDALDSAGYPDDEFEELEDSNEVSRELGLLVRCVRAARNSGA